MTPDKSISGRTQVVGLLGWPVGHSVSPPMHNSAFAALGLDWRYVPLPVSPAPAERIGEAVRGLVALGLRGANVTVPHKQAVIPFLDQLTPAAQAIGAVNTILVDPNGELHGDNTDARGFIADLRDHGVDPAGQRVLVIGAGGSARAVVYGLAEAGAASISILNRTESRAASLVNDLSPHFPACPIAAKAFPQALAAAAGNAELIVNCTSLGMTPDVDGLPWDAALPFRTDQVVYDLVYNPPLTRLIAAARADGATAIGGKGMLVWQGAFAFVWWTGVEPPIEVMKAAIGMTDTDRRT
jgi:shikimate dehydrogenase